MAIVNITVYNDADFYRAFIWTTAAEVPINLAGGTLEMMLRKRAEDDVAVLRLGSDTGEIEIIDAAGGKFALHIPQLELERLDLGEYDQSNVFTKDGAKTRIWSGSFINKAGATR